MRHALLLLSFLSLFTINLSGQTIAQKLPVKQRQEAINHCGHKSIWVKGHWEWDVSSDTYIWIEGQCEPHKKGYTYIPGRWVKVQQGWQWQEGAWRKI
ncbi:MAG: hypothetical protein AB8H47_10425 [Bacteroidia bacterium]